MFLYPVYKAIKQYLTANLSGTATPVYLYIGQYQKGKDNTNYSIPAIYIELPKQNLIVHYPRKKTAAKDVLIKIHYISYAPFKNADNAQQEAAIEQHETRLKEIDKLLTGWNVKAAGLNVTEQFIPNAASLLDFIDKAVVSVINYKTEVYSRHLVE